MAYTPSSDAQCPHCKGKRTVVVKEISNPLQPVVEPPKDVELPCPACNGSGTKGYRTKGQ